MKKVILFFLLIGNVFCFADYEFVIQPRSYLFSTHYDIYNGDQYITSIEKNWLQLHTVWSLCDARGEYANGTARLISLGALFNSKREIDVVNEYSEQISYIQGNWMTTAAGKFIFYDYAYRPYAVAYVDLSRSSVNIVDFHNERLPIAVFRRNHVPGGDYFWHVKVVNEQAIDPRALYVFAGFVTDAYWPVGTREGSSFWDTIQLMLLLDRVREETSKD